MIGAGKRDTLVEFQRSSGSSDDYNQEEEAWEKIESAFVAVRWGTAAERRDAGMNQSRQTATLRVVATTKLRAVTGKDRVLIRGDAWNVVAPPARIGQLELEITISREA